MLVLSVMINLSFTQSDSHSKEEPGADFYLHPIMVTLQAMDSRHM